MPLSITFQPLKSLSARTLNKITTYLTRHSKNTGSTEETLSPGFEHWASAIKFDENRSVQESIDSIIGFSISPDTFTASYIIDPDDPDQDSDPHNIMYSLNVAVNSTNVTPGSKIGITAGLYGLPQETSSFFSDVAVCGEDVFSTTIYTSGTVTGSGGMMYLSNGTFSNLTFRGLDNRMITIAREGDVTFENCVFECYDPPLINIEPKSTTLFKDCIFSWKSAQDPHAMIEYMNLPNDTEPGTYTTFSNCKFVSLVGCTFFQYKGFDNLGTPDYGGWSSTISRATTLRFLKCNFANWTYDSITYPPTPLNNTNRALVEVVKHHGAEDVPFRVNLEIVHSHFEVYPSDFALLSDASMTTMLLSTIGGTSFDAFNVRSGQEIVADPNDIMINTGLTDSADSAFMYGNTYFRSQYLAYRPSFISPSKIFIVEEDVAGSLSIGNVNHESYSSLTALGGRKYELSGSYVMIEGWETLL